MRRLRRGWVRACAKPALAHRTCVLGKPRRPKYLRTSTAPPSLDNDSCHADSHPSCGGFMATNNIVLIHGLWMTPLSFEYWAHHYSERGYSVFAPSWPGMERDIRALRRSPDSYAALGIRQIVDHYERFALQLEEPPILIGHG